MKLYGILSFLALAIGFSACSKDSEAVDYDTVDNYYRNVTAIEIEVAYEPGAEPYTTINNNENLWRFSENNIEALFTGRPIAVDVTVPTTLAGMNVIPDQGRDNYSAQNILNLAKLYRKGANTATLGNLWVVFLDGYFKSGDTLRTDVLGVNITGTSITAIFKPVVNSGTMLATQRRFLEQSTVVHEIGHAIGLVNAGIPLTSNHHDTEHGAHCTNNDCVMYWLNEGATNLSFLTSMNLTTIVFGPECLQDTRSFQP